MEIYSVNIVEKMAFQKVKQNLSISGPRKHPVKHMNILKICNVFCSFVSAIEKWDVAGYIFHGHV